jgi:hypothetical protein
MEIGKRTQLLIDQAFGIGMCTAGGIIMSDASVYMGTDSPVMGLAYLVGLFACASGVWAMVTGVKDYIDKSG